MENIKLSKNLSLKEVIKSNTATANGIDNSPTNEHLNNLKKLAVEIFQPVRDALDVPIGISSGYRSEALNKVIRNASRTSQHCKGEAIDLDADIFGKTTNADIFNYIKKNLDFDQLIWEFGNDTTPDWVHVSYKSYEENRNQILQAVRVNGKVQYIKLN